MPDVPGSGPPDPDSNDRLLEVIKACSADTPIRGLKLSPGIARMLATAEPIHGVIYFGGVPHHLYEAFGVGFLSPAVV